MEKMDGVKGTRKCVATIKNDKHPSREVEILYVPEKNAFVTSGIYDHFGVKEILIPAYLVIRDIELMGTIISCFLDEISLAQENESTFSYCARFSALDQDYTLTEIGDYMKLDLVH